MSVLLDNVVMLVKSAIQILLPTKEVLYKKE